MALTEKQKQLINDIREKNDIINIIKDVGITIEDKPTSVTSRPGYKWVPCQVVAGGAITWIEEEDPEAKGTASRPIMFAAGMGVYENYFYTDGDTRYVCVKTGTADSLTNNEMFKEL